MQSNGTTPSPQLNSTITPGSAEPVTQETGAVVRPFRRRRGEGALDEPAYSVRDGRIYAQGTLVVDADVRIEREHAIDDRVTHYVFRIRDTLGNEVITDPVPADAAAKGAYLEHRRLRVAMVPGTATARERLWHAVRYLSHGRTSVTAPEGTGWHAPDGPVIFHDGRGAIGPKGRLNEQDGYAPVPGKVGEVFRLGEPLANEPARFRERLLTMRAELAQLPPELGIPMLGAVLRPLFGEVAAVVGLVGDWSAGKSGLLAYGASYVAPRVTWDCVPFGIGTEAKTRNGPRELAYLAGHVPVPMDDSAPDRGIRSSVEDLNVVVRAFYGGQDKLAVRMRDGARTLREMRDARGMLVYTGENLPTGSAETRTATLRVTAAHRLPAVLKGLERAAIVNRTRAGRTDVTATLVQYAAAAMPADGWLRSDPGGLLYVDVAQRADELLSSRSWADQGTGMRRATVHAELWAAWRYLIAAAVDVGALSRIEGATWKAWIRDGMIASLGLQAAEHVDEGRRLLALVGTALTGDGGHLVNEHGACPDETEPARYGWTPGTFGRPNGKRLGFVDSSRPDRVLLLPGPTIAAAARVADDEGAPLALSRITAGQTLDRSRLILHEQEGAASLKGRRLAVETRIGALGKPYVWHVPADAIWPGDDPRTDRALEAEPPLPDEPPPDVDVDEPRGEPERDELAGELPGVKAGSEPAAVSSAAGCTCTPEQRCALCTTRELLAAVPLQDDSGGEGEGEGAAAGDVRAGLETPERAGLDVDEDQDQGDGGAGGSADRAQDVVPRRAAGDPTSSGPNDPRDRSGTRGRARPSRPSRGPVAMLATGDRLHFPGGHVAPHDGLGDDLAVFLARTVEAFRGPGVVLLDVDAAAALGFPKREPKLNGDGALSKRAINAPVLEPARAAGWTVTGLRVWMTFYAPGRPDVHVCVLPWALLSDDLSERTTRDPAWFPLWDPSPRVVLDRLASWHATMGTPYQGTPGWAACAALRKLPRSVREPSWYLDPEKLQGVRGLLNSNNEPAYDPRQWGDQDDDRAAVGLDARRAYLSGLINAEVAFYRPRQTGAIPFDPARRGMWLAELEPWTDERMPHPAGLPGPGATDVRWCATETLKLLAELQEQGVYGGFRIIESYTSAPNEPGKTRSGRVLRPIGERIRDGFDQATAAGDEWLALAYKLAYRSLWGQLNSVGADGSRGFVWRPDWHFAVKANARLTLWRRAWKAGREQGVWPLRFSTDEVVYPREAIPADVKTGDVLFGAFRIGEGLGHYRLNVKGKGGQA